MRWTEIENTFNPSRLDHFLKWGQWTSLLYRSALGRPRRLGKEESNFHLMKRAILMRKQWSLHSNGIFNNVHKTIINCVPDNSFVYNTAYINKTNKLTKFQLSKVVLITSKHLCKWSGTLVRRLRKLNFCLHDAL